MAGDGTKVGRERKYHRRVEIKEMEENIAKMEGRLIPYSLDWSVGLIRDHHNIGCPAGCSVKIVLIIRQKIGLIIRLIFIQLIWK